MEITQPGGGVSGGGTVTSVSVASANGFAGTVADPTTTPAITLTTSNTTGSVLFASSSALGQDNANFFYDSTNKRLGLRNAAPTATLSLKGAGTTTGKIFDTVDSAGVGKWTMLDNGKISYNANTTGQLFSLIDSTYNTYGNVAFMTPGASDPWAGASVGIGLGFFYGTSNQAAIYVDNASIFKIGAKPSGVPVYISFTSTGVGMTRVNMTGAYVGDFAPQLTLDDTPGAEAGFTRPAADTIGVVTARTERMRFAAGGNVGINTTSPAKMLDVSGDIQMKTAGNGLYIKEGTNATMGIATLTAGTVTVSTTKVTASSRIFLTIDGGTLTNVGATYVSVRTAGTSFTISSTNVLDTSDVSWLIIEPA